MVRPETREEREARLAGGLLTVDEAAEIVRVSPSSVRAYIRDGTLPASRVAGRRRVLLRRQDVMGLLQPIRRPPGAGGTGSG